jgi:hypothetical protein
MTSSDEATPDYGYGFGDAAPSAAANDKYAYESTETDASKHKYGDTNDLGYGSTHSSESMDGMHAERPPRRERPIRRGSITKYSLDVLQEVKNMDSKMQDEGFTDTELDVPLDTSDGPTPPPLTCTKSKRSLRIFSRKK